VEEEDKTEQPLQSTGEEQTRGDQVELSERDNNSTMQSEHTVQKKPQYWYHAFRSPRL
jgi:cytoskeletal protein RodZ